MITFYRLKDLWILRCELNYCVIGKFIYMSNEEDNLKAIFAYITNDGPNIELCRTPKEILCMDDLFSFNWTNSFLRLQDL